MVMVKVVPYSVQLLSFIYSSKHLINFKNAFYFLPHKRDGLKLTLRVNELHFRW